MTYFVTMTISSVHGGERGPPITYAGEINHDELGTRQNNGPGAMHRLYVLVLASAEACWEDNYKDHGHFVDSFIVDNYAVLPDKV